jgi:hypothetical protein
LNERIPVFVSISHILLKSISDQLRNKITISQKMSNYILHVSEGSVILRIGDRSTLAFTEAFDATVDWDLDLAKEHSNYFKLMSRIHLFK